MSFADAPPVRWRKPCATTRPIYSIARTHSAMGRCEYGFHFGSTSDPKGQGFYICGSRSVLEDGPFHTMQQDQRRDTHRGVVLQRSDEITWYPEIHCLRSGFQVPQSLLGHFIEESGYQTQLQYHLPPTDGRTDRGNQSNSRDSPTSFDSVTIDSVGFIIATC